MPVQCGHMLPHRLHPLAAQFGIGRSCCIDHIFEIGIVEHCAMYYATTGQFVECVARHLLAAHKNIVAAGCPCIHTKTLQSILDHQHVTVEGKIDIGIGGNVREHQVAAVGKDTAATTLAAIKLDIIGLAERHIHFALNQLVSPEYDRGLNLPDEKVLMRRKFPCNILLHSQIKRQTAVLFLWKFYIDHVE